MSSQDYENDAQNLADKVGNKVNEFAQASDAVSEVSERVRENPLTGLLAAGAIGLVIGLLAGRK
ncbi:MAG: CsbD family protein [Klebsiella michiganensis]|nr:CsbD family protein [Klebsiella michiganensis]